jgi:hypothetical protein
MDSFMATVKEMGINQENPTEEEAARVIERFLDRMIERAHAKKGP